MEKIYPSLDDLLNDCTVRVKTKGGHGTGFFVAPGLILTCAHVIEDALEGNTPVSAYCKYNQETVPVGRIGAEDVFPGLYPDLALLRVEIRDHPCVLLGTEFRAFADFYSYGYTRDHPDGESTTGEFEGTLEHGGTLIKLKDGQVKHGASGSPLLNEKTGAVCGMITNTRDRNSDLGGAGVSTDTIFTLFPKLRKLNEKYHKGDKTWLLLVQGIKAQILFKSIFIFQYKKPEEIPHHEYFVARDDLVEKIEEVLQKKSGRVLMDGIAGIGKTTLAYAVVERHLNADKGSVLWVEVGDANVENIIESIADFYEDKNLLNSTRDLKFKVQLLHDLLANRGIGLLVVDNLGGSDTWRDFADAIPQNLPVLITSRTRFSIGDFIDINQLSYSQALRLLEYIVQDKTISTDPDAAFLCRLFGYHPLALQILGANMREVPLNPKAQRRRLELNPVKLRSAVYEDKLWALVEESLNGLDAFERTVFLAFGFFPANGITLNILTIYLRKSHDELQTALDRLMVRNLVEKRSDVDFYFMQDVIFHYVKSLTKPVEKNKSSLIRTVLSYLKKYRSEFDSIKLDIDNLLAIIKLSDKLYLVKIISYLVIGNFPLQEGKSYTDQRGYSLGLVEQLDRALTVAKILGDEFNPTVHYLLGKRGNAAFRRGEYQLAAEKYKEELELAPDDDRRAIVGAIFARTLAYCQRVQESRENFERAKQIAKQIGDDELLGSVLEQESWAAGELKDYKYVRAVAKDQLLLVEANYKKNSNPDINAVEAYFYALLNLGTAELDLAKGNEGDFREASKLHEVSLTVARQSGNNLLLAYALTNLGEDYHYLGDKESALNAFQCAYELWYSQKMDKNKEYVLGLAGELGYTIAELKKEEP